MSKTFVLVSCGDSDVSSGVYGDALTMIREQNITLHHVTAKEIALKRQSKKRSDELFGFNERGAFTARTLNR